MAKFKIKWTNFAKNDLFSIFEYYNKKNGNNRYSSKLFHVIKNKLANVSENPYLGKKTDIDGIRVIIAKHYHIIYEIIENVILIIMLWDSRRNPEEYDLDLRLNKWCSFFNKKKRLAYVFITS